MATPRKLPSGRWNIVVYSHTDEQGKKKYVSFTADTKMEANRLGAEFMANRSKESKPQDALISDLIERYINSKSNILSPKTLREYKGYLKQYKGIGNIRLGSLTSEDLLSLLQQELHQAQVRVQMRKVAKVTKVTKAKI